MDRCAGTVLSVLVGLLISLPAFGADLSSADLSVLNMNPKIVTLIHIGDIHGHLVPQPNLKIKDTGEPVGGLARLYTKIQEIRQRSVNTPLLINAGDTTQGSAEATFTRGGAMANVLNHFDIDAFAPGNWDFVYGLARFRELFIGSGGIPPLAQPSGWTALAANAYTDTIPPNPLVPCGTLPRILPPYVVKKVGDLKVGILGFTTDRGPQVVGTNVTAGICFTKGDAEVPVFVKKLRDPKPKEGEAVDLVVMVSELGLANNIRLAEKYPGIDVILSSDMHERTPEPVVTSTGTVIVEEGEGGAMLGELTIKVGPNGVKDWTWTAHIIDSNVAEDLTIAAVVAEVRKTFVSGPDFCKPTNKIPDPCVNPFNGTTLQAAIDTTVVGYTTIPLYRGNFSQEEMPGVIEGSSHDFLTDAFRMMTGADIGAIRGFRFGAHVGPATPAAPAPITLADLYNFIPIGPMIAKGTVSGAFLKNHPMAGIEPGADGALNSCVKQWTGGWLFNFSGLTMEIDPRGVLGSLAKNIKVGGVDLDTSQGADYTYASYFYPSDLNFINRLPASNITVFTKSGVLLPWPLLPEDRADGTDVVIQYLESLRVKLGCSSFPSSTCPEVTEGTLELNRIKLLAALPEPQFPIGLPPEQRNPEIQPLRGSAQLPLTGCPL
jgi:2',3'-cyclic-nucleotide 2'-phosphodiesterase (5'-nucleotidase family)